MKIIHIFKIALIPLLLSSCNYNLSNERYKVTMNGQSATGYLVDTQTGATYFLNRDEIYPVRKPNCTEHYIPDRPYQCRVEMHYDLEALDPTLQKEKTTPKVTPPRTSPSF